MILGVTLLSPKVGLLILIVEEKLVEAVYNSEMTNGIIGSLWWNIPEIDGSVGTSWKVGRYGRCGSVLDK